MKTSLFDYKLPKNLIANSPCEPRDSSKLMVVDRKSGKISHHVFSELPDLLTPNDVLVFNESKVFPARLVGNKESGGKVEILLLHQFSNNTKWRAIHRGKVKQGQKVKFGNVKAEITNTNREFVDIEFLIAPERFDSFINSFGQTPLPPYIENKDKETELRKKYQTVYATSIGSAAAPTAGLHFTKELISKLKDNGVETYFVTLHVGLGTFAPVKSGKLEEHTMHSEYFVLDKEAADCLNKAKHQRKRIISVGTTTTRVLETLSDEGGSLRPGEGNTSIFIYPPYKFKFVDALLTNFHLPKSTLLALTSAFVSKPNTDTDFTSFSESVVGKGYKEAMKQNYRFYSFGDAMLIG